MSGYRKSVLFLLRRCVAVSQDTLPPGIKTRGGVLSGCAEFIQRRTWASTTRTACALQSAVRTSRYSFCTKAGEPCEEYPPLPAYQSDSEPQKNEVYIVQVKGLPWSCTAQDILQFFSDCRIRDGVKGIHLTADKQGRSMGLAYIEVEHEEDVSKALEKHRQYLGPRYVEVSEVTNRDAEVILKEALQAPGNGGVVRLRGLPFTCTKADIEQFFSGLEIVDNGITFIEGRQGRNTGQAFVQFSSKEAAVEALRRDREVIGHRYIEVFPSTLSEVLSRRTTSAPPQRSLQSADRKTDSASSSTATQPKTDAGGPSVFPQSSSLPLHYIRMRGLPFQVSGEDIVKFFSPLVVSKILIECGPDGRPSGEADVHFRSHRDATDAMSRDRLLVGGRYIELFLNSVPESYER